MVLGDIKHKEHVVTMQRCNLKKISTILLVFLKSEQWSVKKQFLLSQKNACLLEQFQRTKKHLNTLLLIDARLYESAPVKPAPKPRLHTTPASYYPKGKRPEAWLREVEGLGKHTATSAFKCSCCGRNFSARQGCKIEFRDVYFCKACADQIFKKSDKGYLRIVYTPMGNKR